MGKKRRSDDSGHRRTTSTKTMNAWSYIFFSYLLTLIVRSTLSNE